MAGLLLSWRQFLKLFAEALSELGEVDVIDVDIVRTGELALAARRILHNCPGFDGRRFPSSC